VKELIPMFAQPDTVRLLRDYPRIADSKSRALITRFAEQLAAGSNSR